MARSMPSTWVRSRKSARLSVWLDQHAAELILSTQESGELTDADGTALAVTAAGAWRVWVGVGIVGR